jgi:hypothetical protein
VTNAEYETDIASLLADLSSVQEDLLALLAEKRNLMAVGDVDGLNAAQHRADALIDRLSACQQRRQALLVRAGKEGLPAGNVRALAAAVAENDVDQLDASFADTRRRTRLLQHHSLTNWVIVQRSLIHLSQMIEILATGGRLRPTYDSRNVADDRGGLVDRAV